MKIKTLSLLAVSVLLVAGVLYWTSDSRQDRAVWSTLHDQVETGSASRVEVRGVLEPYKRTLDASETQEFARHVFEAEFDRSNREKRGSTSDGQVTLFLEDGSKISMNYYLGTENEVSSIFQLSPLEIDRDSQFYIKNQQLADWMTTWIQK